MRVDALEREWQLRPPVHWLVAAYLDYKPSGARSADRTEAIDAFASAAPRMAGPAPLDTSAWANRHAVGDTKKDVTHG